MIYQDQAGRAGGGGEAKSYSYASEKAWPSVNYSILSVLYYMES
jgi:hypothetical protein